MVLFEVIVTSSRILSSVLLLLLQHSYKVDFAVSNLSISGLLAPGSASSAPSPAIGPLIGVLVDPSPNRFSTPSSGIGVARPTLFSVSVLALKSPPPCSGRPNLNGKALPSVAGRLRDAVPAMVLRGPVECSVAGGEGRGEAVVEGREGELCG